MKKTLLTIGLTIVSCIGLAIVASLIIYSHFAEYDSAVSRGEERARQINADYDVLLIKSLMTSTNDLTKQINSDAVVIRALSASLSAATNGVTGLNTDEQFKVISDQRDVILRQAEVIKGLTVELRNQTR